MGYRSDVYIATSKDAIIHYCSTVEDITPQLNYFSCKERSDVVLYSIYQTKCYDSDPVVQAINRMIESFESTDTKFAYVRPGEEWDDIEYLGDVDEFGLSLVRKLEW